MKRPESRIWLQVQLCCGCDATSVKLAWNVSRPLLVLIGPVLPDWGSLGMLWRARLLRDGLKEERSGVSEKTEFRDAQRDLYLCLVSVKLFLQRANAKRSQSIMTNPVLLPKTTSLQVIWVALFCNLSSSYLPLHTFKKEEVPPFSRRKGILFSRWTSYSHGLSQTGKTWQIPDLCHGCKTERHGTTCCAASALPAVVWTDGIVSGATLEGFFLILIAVACGRCSSSYKDCKIEGKATCDKKVKSGVKRFVGSGSNQWELSLTTLACERSMKWEYGSFGTMYSLINPRSVQVEACRCI